MLAINEYAAQGIKRVNSGIVERVKFAAQLRLSQYGEGNYYIVLLKIVWI